MQSIKRCSGPDSLRLLSWNVHHQTTATEPRRPQKQEPATSLLVLLNTHPPAITTPVTAGSMPISGGHRMWSR